MLLQHGQPMVISGLQPMLIQTWQSRLMQGCKPFCPQKPVNSYWKMFLPINSRQCNGSSPGYEGCEYLCCGRGHITKTREILERCQCKYISCCYSVQCKTCRSVITTYECNWTESSRKFIYESHASKIALPLFFYIFASIWKHFCFHTEAFLTSFHWQCDTQ